MGWWKRPGVLLFLAVVALAALGWWIVFRSVQRIPVRVANVDGLELHLTEARWILDQMDHGENFQKPSTMMPDMPDWGKQRVTLDLALHNRAEAPRRFDGSEFFLVPEIGDGVAPMGAQVGEATLGAGQALNTALHFDFDTRLPHGKLRVEWRRGEEVIYLPIPEPAEHYHLRPRGGEVAFPPRARLVSPLGDAVRGRALYDGVYGCVACHGDPELPGTNNVGPHLAGVATAAWSRVPGLDGDDYLYQSILEPGANLAPECKNGPCTAPSAMPEYASLVSLQDLADLLVFLMSLEGNAAPAEEAEASAPATAARAATPTKAGEPAESAPPQ